MRLILDGSVIFSRCVNTLLYLIIITFAFTTFAFLHLPFLNLHFFFTANLINTVKRLAMKLYKLPKLPYVAYRTEADVFYVYREKLKLALNFLLSNFTNNVHAHNLIITCNDFY